MKILFNAGDRIWVTNMDAVPARDDLVSWPTYYLNDPEREYIVKRSQFNPPKSEMLKLLNISIRKDDDWKELLLNPRPDVIVLVQEWKPEEITYPRIIK